MGALEKMFDGHYSLSSADLLGLRHNHDWYCHSNGVWCDGRDGRITLGLAA